MGIIVGLIFLLIGSSVIAGSVLDWNFFMESNWPTYFSKVLGSRDRARAAYAIIGMILVFYGLRTIILFFN